MRDFALIVSGVVICTFIGIGLMTVIGVWSDWMCDQGFIHCVVYR